MPMRTDTSTAGKVLPRSAAQAVAAQWRATGQQLVFTNGCFDLLHAGHVTYLEDAASLGTRLIVGLNTDASVRRLKGATRPVMDEQSRARVLAGLACVSAVVLFDEDTPLELILELMPDVLAKGGDYTPETIVGAAEVTAAGGHVVVIPLLPGYSTTSAIDRILGK